MSVELTPGNPLASIRSPSPALRLLLVVLLWMLAGTTTAATFVVNNRFDAGTGGCTASECTLREAIVAANATAAADTINFSFGAFAGRTEILIQPTSALPTIIHPVTINGYSQELAAVNTDPVISNARINIRVDGANAGATSGFAVCGNNVRIRGLSITRFSRRGIDIGRDVVGNTCSPSGSAVMGNFIGLASNGITAAGNLDHGIVASAAATIGSDLPADRNVISANDNIGIHVTGPAGDGSQIIGNLVGTDKTGILDRGNLEEGLDIRTNSVQIGTPAAPNRIAFNRSGILVSDNSVMAVRFFANDFHFNDDLGIDLISTNAPRGLTLNDDFDGDVGGNGLQNFLDDGFTAARTVSGINLQGTLRRPTSGSLTFTIAAYLTPACHSSAHGEGDFIGSASQVTTTATASINVDIPLADQPPPGSFITTTITAPDGSTSEFSTCVALDPPPLVVNSTDDVADGVCDAAHCSLRDAIIAANADPGPSLIHFNIATPASGELLIQLNSQLPTITAPVTIDGYSQSGTSENTDPLVSNAVLRVRLDGSGVSSVRLLDICSPSTVRGLSLTGATVGGGRAIDVCSAAGGDVRIAGNFIGLLSDGVTAGQNVLGIVANGPTVIGGDDPADRNVLGGNGIGINIQDHAGTVVLGNLLGTDKSGALDRGGITGIQLLANSRDTQIGSPVAPNVLRFSVLGISSNNQALIRRNYFGFNHFSSNDQLGIDIAGDGQTLNDPDDADDGPNGLQNFPLIIRAERSAAGLLIGGSLDVPVGTSNVPYVIGVYANPACDPSGFGEGERFLGSATVNLTQTTGEGFQFELATNDPLEPGVQITTTASGPEGTSEFSACVPATDTPPGIAVTTAVDPGDGVCDLAECTLREAITLANTQPGPDLIRFDIPGDGPHDIQLASLLPVITEGLSIDGYTQAGASPNAAASGSDAVLQIQINGLGTRTDLLRTCTTELVEIRGLALVRASFTAVGTQRNDTLDCTAVGSLRMGGNFVGLRPDGTAFSNFSGISVANTFAAIGGSALADRNIISNSNAFGIQLAGAGAEGSTVQNNLIGTGTGVGTDLGNGDGGVVINGTSQVTLGGEGVLRNLIAFNNQGVIVLGAGGGNRLHANEFVANNALGIDLSAGAGPNGVTPNDVNDVDTGPNGLQNFPLLTDGSATPTSITINGTLDVPAGIVTPVAYTLTFYESAACDASGNGEGEIHLGSFPLNFASNAENFSVTLPMPPAPGPTVITATATDPLGNTSEFSSCLAAPQPVTIFTDGFE